MCAAIKHPMPDRVKPSFVIFDIRALWRSNTNTKRYCVEITCGNSGRQRVRLWRVVTTSWLRQRLPWPQSIVDKATESCSVTDWYASCVHSWTVAVLSDSFASRTLWHWLLISRLTAPSKFLKFTTEHRNTNHLLNIQDATASSPEKVN